MIRSEREVVDDAILLLANGNESDCNTDHLIVPVQTITKLLHFPHSRVKNLLRHHEAEQQQKQGLPNQTLVEAHCLTHLVINKAKREQILGDYYTQERLQREVGLTLEERAFRLNYLNPQLYLTLSTLQSTFTDRR